MTGKEPFDVIDSDTGRVRVLADRCSSCVFRPGNPMRLTPGRLKQLVAQNLRAGALLTCHQTLPASPYGVDPAVCAGFWEAYGMQTMAGRLAAVVIGIVRVAPPSACTREVSR